MCSMPSKSFNGLVFFYDEIKMIIAFTMEYHDNV